MIPVRKPGRPLSTCPCPPGRPCACGGVRVAIPKKQKCACPSKSSNGTNASEESSPAGTPTSPTRPSYRVSKASSGVKVNKKQSFDPVNLERMDPNSINLIAAPTNGSGVPSGIPAPNSAIPVSQPEFPGLNQGMGLVSAGSSNIYSQPSTAAYGPSVSYGMGFHYSQTNPLQHNITQDGGFITSVNGGFDAAMSHPHPPSQFVNGNHAPSSLDGQAHPPVANHPLPKIESDSTTPAPGGCCGGNKFRAEPDTVVTAAPGYTSLYSTPQLQPSIPSPSPAGGSCCGGTKIKGEPDSLATPQQGYGSLYNTPQLQPAVPFPTVFTYPSDCGSWQHPLDPFSWQQIVAQTVNSMSSQPSSSSIPQPQQESHVTTSNSFQTTSGTTVQVDGMMHQCSCGDGCQCVGCLAHPFNSQMYQYVNNAYAGSNGSSPRTGGSDYPTTTLASQSQVAATTTGQDYQQQQQQQQHQQQHSPLLPEAALTPASSEGAGASPREEQSLSTMDYFFVNIPISGLMCGGSVESCPCGDSCECAGCLVHGNANTGLR